MWLAYLHPAAMIVVLLLGLVTLREGLLLRRARLVGGEVDKRRHRRLGRVYGLAIAAGYGSGLASLGILRGEPVWESFHSLLATAALAGVTIAYVLGRRLEARTEATARSLHLIAGSVGLLCAIAGAAAGIAILP